LQFPQSQWKALRITNALERINGDFRRRTKTQASGVKMTSTKTSLRFARYPTRFDPVEDGVRWHALGRVGQVFAVARHNFLAEPALHGRVALQQRAHAVAHDFADGGISSGLHLALAASAMSSGSVMLNCWVVLIQA